MTDFIIYFKGLKPLFRNFLGFAAIHSLNYYSSPQYWVIGTRSSPFNTSHQEMTT